jgi:hypothetical protein
MDIASFKALQGTMGKALDYEPKTHEERVDIVTADAQCIAHFGLDTLRHGEFASFAHHATELNPILLANWFAPRLARCFKHESAIDFYQTIQWGNFKPETYKQIKPYAQRFLRLLECVRTSKNPARKGYVYIAKADFGHTIYKIGMSKDPRRRVDDINGYLPVTVSLLHKIKTDDMILVERLIHQQFENNAYQNEWFNPPSNELEALMTIDSISFYSQVQP